MDAVKLINLSIGYRQKIVATHLNATLQEGQFTCLLGSNGVGKSTLLRTLTGYLPPLEGHVSLQGQLLEQLTYQQRAQLLSIVLTAHVPADQLRVGELVGMGRYPYANFFGKLDSHDLQLVDEALTMVGISHLKERLVKSLSDGERQKTMIAKALAQQTPFIFLDEPTAFLDFPSKVGVMQLLKKLSHEFNKTILLSTHDVELALQISDQLWLMHQDRLFTGSPKALAQAGTLSAYIDQPNMHFDAQHLRIVLD